MSTESQTSIVIYQEYGWVDEARPEGEIYWFPPCELPPRCLSTAEDSSAVHHLGRYQSSNL